MRETSLPLGFTGGRLRRMRPEDLEAFRSYRALPELGRYQGWSPMSEGDSLKFLVEMSNAPMFVPGKWVQLAIADLELDSIIGDIGLYLSADGETGELGFTLEPSAQGRGIASRAVKEALQLLFAATSISHVLGITDERNLPSIRLLERLGFKLREIRNAVFKGEECLERVYVASRNDA